MRYRCQNCGVEIRGGLVGGSRKECPRCRETMTPPSESLHEARGSKEERKKGNRGDDNEQKE